MIHPTTTFKLNFIDDQIGKFNTAKTPEIRRCAYCGEQAQEDDQGDIRGYDWIHYCTCPGANEEAEIKEEMVRLKSRLHSLEGRLEHHRRSALTRKMVKDWQYKDELVALNKKYKKEGDI